MRFVLNESISTNANKTEVFHALKNQFLKISDSVSEKEFKLAVRDIKASFGFFRHDTSLIVLQEKNDGFLMTADVKYRPSGSFWVVFIIGLFIFFLGWIIPIITYLYQKKIVREEIQNTFLRVKNEFKTTNSKLTYSNSNLDQIEKLFSLKEKGIITEEEFNNKKKELLGS